jgi:hypothetical protein
MKMSEDDKLLESFFEAARADKAQIPHTLEARILADAAALVPVVARQTSAPGWRRLIDEMFMGWYGLGGLAAASAAGIWLGFAPPSGLPDAGAVLLGQYDGTVDLFDGSGLTAALLEDG